MKMLLPAGIRSLARPMLPSAIVNDTETENDKADDKAKAENQGLAERLMKSRTVLVFGEIDDKLAKATVAQLLALDAASDEPIKMIVSSPGGHVESGDAIHDAVRFINAPVQMIGSGWVASAGVMIYLSAAKENRFCLPNTRYMIHQPAGGAGGRAVDIEIEAREIIKVRERINQQIARETGQPLEKVAEDTDRNFWMSADEAKDYGIVTKIITSASELG